MDVYADISIGNIKIGQDETSKSVHADIISTASHKTCNRAVKVGQCGNKFIVCN